MQNLQQLLQQFESGNGTQPAAEPKPGAEPVSPAEPAKEPKPEPETVIILEDDERPKLRRGKPLKYHPKRVRRICDCLERGMTIKHAAACAGIDQDTITKWRKKYPEFNEKVEEAIAGGIDYHLEKVQRAAEEGDLRASLWWLEHVTPELYGRSRLEVAAKVSQDVSVSHAISVKDLSGLAELRKFREEALAKPV